MASTTPSGPEAPSPPVFSPFPAIDPSVPFISFPPEEGIFAPPMFSPGVDPFAPSVPPPGALSSLGTTSFPRMDSSSPPTRTPAFACTFLSIHTQTVTVRYNTATMATVLPNMAKIALPPRFLLRLPDLSPDCFATSSR